jgi:hypothetical protein
MDVLWIPYASLIAVRIHIDIENAVEIAMEVERVATRR